jgi:protease YdgD
MTLAQHVLFAILGGAVIAAGPLALGEEAPVGDARPMATKPAAAATAPGSADTRGSEDGRLPPHAAVGHFTGTMVCTAAIVLHPRIIITASHCLTERDGSLIRARGVFRPARPAGADVDRFEATLLAVGARQDLTAQSADEAANDWAILVLDRAPTGTRPLGVHSLTRDALGQLGALQLMMPSYSADEAGHVRLGIDPGCSVDRAAWGLLLHNCQAARGASGAPLLIQDQQWYAMVGIHSSSVWAVDPKTGSLKFAGHSAVGAWRFADVLRKLFEDLNGGGDPHASTALAH